jgi:hypothetical protein
MVAGLLALFGELHANMSKALATLDDAALNWTPHEHANSIATLIVHTLGSEAETLRTLAAQEAIRDRDAEFRAQPPRAALEALVASADTSLQALTPVICGLGISSRLALPTLARSDVRPGYIWLAGNYGHAREHFGQILLTRQLFEAAHGRP